MMNDSSINCLKSIERSAPNTFRMPTSRARFEEVAVERLMKLIQAIARINKAMAEKM